MAPIPVGARGVSALKGKPEHLANQFKDSILPEVLATPVMILIMENAALNAVRPYLAPGESVVGTKIDIEHLAATPVGHVVEAEAEVVAVDRRRIVFKVSARDEREEIGRGMHERMIIDRARMAAKLAAKPAGR